MKKQFCSLIIVVFVFSHCITYAQYCSDVNRFSEIPVFTNEQLTSLSGITYGSALNAAGQLQDLKLNIFYPSFDYDTSAKRPLIVLMHVGQRNVYT